MIEYTIRWILSVSLTVAGLAILNVHVPILTGVIGLMLILLSDRIINV